MLPSTEKWLQDVRRGDYHQALKSFSKIVETLDSTTPKKGDDRREIVEPITPERQGHLLLAIEQFCVFGKRQLRVDAADRDANWNLLANVAAVHGSVAASHASFSAAPQPSAEHLPSGAVSQQAAGSHARKRTQPVTDPTSAGTPIDPGHTAVLGLWKLGYTSNEIAAVVGRTSNDVAKVVAALTTNPISE